jgi:endoglucanase
LVKTADLRQLFAFQAVNSYSVCMFSSIVGGRHRRAVLIGIVSAIGMPIAFGQTNPVKLAAVARIDLDSPTVILTNGQMLAADGKLARPSWVTGSAQARSFTAEFPVNHFAWHEVALRFTPLSSGSVECKLMGPWQQTANGRVYKQEVLWDAVQVEGSEVANGGFENGDQNWHGGGTVEVVSGAPEIAGAGPRAREGQHYGRVWHNQPFITTLAVTANVPVTLRACARAALPSNYPEMRRIAATNSPAHLAAGRFMHGANCGNYLEVPPRQSWSVKHTPDDLAHMRQEGFDHVRIPAGWHHYAGPAPEFGLAKEIFDKTDTLVTNALSMGLNVLLNIHHFDQFTSDPSACQNELFAIWRQIAEHYAQVGLGGTGTNGILAFELLNEPKDRATTTAMNPIYAQAIGDIRKINPTRTIFIGPGRWNSVDELSQLILPNDDSNIIVTVHNYDPFYFTHQGATWTKGATDTKGVIFPGPPATPLSPAPGAATNQSVLNWLKDYNTLPSEQNPSSPRVFAGKLRLAREWSDYYGRPVHVGEFGCYTSADAKSRAKYYADFRRACEEQHIGWALRDWKAGFRYWDEKRSQPMEGMREALSSTGR